METTIDRNHQLPQVAQGLAQIITTYLEQQFGQQINNLTSRVETVETRVDNVERRLASEGLTRSQGRALQRAVAIKAHETAKVDNSNVRQHFANIYGGLKDKYNVPSYLDIPRDKFQEALRLISQYDGSSRDWWRE